MWAEFETGSNHSTCRKGIYMCQLTDIFEWTFGYHDFIIIVKEKLVIVSKIVANTY